MKEEIIKRFETLYNSLGLNDVEEFCNCPPFIAKECKCKSRKQKIENFLLQEIAKAKEEMVKKIADDISKIIVDSKATFFVNKGQKVRIPKGEAMYELKAEISNNVSLYFYNLLNQ